MTIIDNVDENCKHQRDEGICVRSFIVKISAHINEVVYERMRSTEFDRTAQQYGISQSRNVSCTILKHILN